MREIKFRGQRVDNKEWVYGYYYMYPINKNPVNDHHYIINFEWSDLVAGYSDLRFEVIPSTVGQYIGEKDKNGNPIYEGDIVRYDDYSNGGVIGGKQPTRISEVKIHDLFTGIKMPGSGTTNAKEFEIIGNIHSNPSLLTTHP